LFGITEVMKTQYLLGALVIAVLIGIGAWWWQSGNPVPPPEIQDDQESVSLELPLAPGGGESLATPAPGTLSLPAFSKQNIVGSDFKVGEVLARNDAYTRYFITYKSGDLRISGIMNVPTGTGPFPVLILNHGYIDPAIYTNGRGLKREQDYLARQGFVVVHPDYRNHAASDKDEAAELRLRLGYVEDVIAAIEAVRAAGLPYIDGEHIGMLGHSMGGGVAQTIMVTHPELVDAVVLFAPVSADIRDNFNKWIKSRPEVAQRIIALYGSPESHPEFWDNISPLTFLDDVRAPIMLHHGTADESVPIEWSQRTAAALEKEGKDITFYTYPGEPHEFATAWPRVMERTATFFKEHLTTR
jgi:dipeptidyl aminopeptidase/acylaminoacyl peptidase